MKPEERIRRRENRIIYFVKDWYVPVASGIADGLIGTIIARTLWRV